MTRLEQVLYRSHHPRGARGLRGRGGGVGARGLLQQQGTYYDNIPVPPFLQNGAAPAM